MFFDFASATILWLVLCLPTLIAFIYGLDALNGGDND